MAWFTSFGSEVPGMTKCCLASITLSGVWRLNVVIIGSRYTIGSTFCLQSQAIFLHSLGMKIFVQAVAALTETATNTKTATTQATAE